MLTHLKQQDGAHTPPGTPHRYFTINPRLEDPFLIEEPSTANLFHVPTRPRSVGSPLDRPADSSVLVGSSIAARTFNGRRSHRPPPLLSQEGEQDIWHKERQNEASISRDHRQPDGSGHSQSSKIQVDDNTQQHQAPIAQQQLRRSQPKPKRLLKIASLDHLRPAPPSKSPTPDEENVHPALRTHPYFNQTDRAIISDILEEGDELWPMPLTPSPHRKTHRPTKSASALRGYESTRLEPTYEVEARLSTFESLPDYHSAEFLEEKRQLKTKASSPTLGASSPRFYRPEPIPCSSSPVFQTPETHVQPSYTAPRRPPIPPNSPRRLAQRPESISRTPSPSLHGADLLAETPGATSQRPPFPMRNPRRLLFQRPGSLPHASSYVLRSAEFRAQILPPATSHARPYPPCTSSRHVRIATPPTPEMLAITPPLRIPRRHNPVANPAPRSPTPPVRAPSPQLDAQDLQNMLALIQSGAPAPESLAALARFRAQGPRPQPTTARPSTQGSQPPIPSDNAPIQSLSLSSPTSWYVLNELFQGRAPPLSMFSQRLLALMNEHPAVFPLHPELAQAQQQQQQQQAQQQAQQQQQQQAQQEQEQQQQQQQQEQQQGDTTEVRGLTNTQAAAPPAALGRRASLKVVGSSMKKGVKKLFRRGNEGQ